MLLELLCVTLSLKENLFLVNKMLHKISVSHKSVVLSTGGSLTETHFSDTGEKHAKGQKT